MGSASFPSLHLPTFFAKAHTQERLTRNRLVVRLYASVNFSVNESRDGSRRQLPGCRPPRRRGDPTTQARLSVPIRQRVNITCDLPVMRQESGRSFPRPKSHRLLSSSGADFMLLAEAAEKTRMPKAKSVLFAASAAIISTGFTIIGVGAFFLRRLDDHAFGDPGVFYAAVRHYASVTSAGVLV